MTTRAALLAVGALASSAAASPIAQVFTAYGADPTTSLTLSWATSSACTPAAEAGPSATALTPVPAASLTADPRYDFNNAGGLPFYMRARLTGLPAGARVFYRVGCAGASPAWSPVASARTPPARDSASPQPTILLWGDMGRDGGEQVLPALEVEAAAADSGAPGSATFAIIAGDYGYDLHDEAGARGARFMDRLSNISRSLPTMTTIGNHEQATGNATAYTNILGKAMPGPALGHWYSFDAGLIHFVMLSSEVYHMDPFTLDGGSLTISAPAQKAWLEADLAAVDRAVTPWLVAVFHRPFYCSNADRDECANIPLLWPTNPLRVDLEPLFMTAGVDLCVEAHEHSVEVVYPINNGTVAQRDFVAPRAPIHFITGAAGCNEDSGLCWNPIALDSPFTYKALWGPEQYSYSRLRAVNASVLHIEQVKVIPDTSVWLALDIVQPSHGPFPQ